MAWKTFRLNATGAMSVICLVARNMAWSCGVQSVSRFCMKLAIAGNAWLLTVVSMWNTRTVSSMSWPCRMHDGEDPDANVYIGKTSQGEDVTLHKRAAESDLVSYLNLTLVPTDGDHHSKS